jgi:hypothetical protein
MGNAHSTKNVGDDLLRPVSLSIPFAQRRRIIFGTRPPV